MRDVDNRSYLPFLHDPFFTRTHTMSPMSIRIMKNNDRPTANPMIRPSLEDTVSSATFVNKMGVVLSAKPS